MAARENLNGAVNLPVAPNDGVQLAVARFLGEVLAVIIQKLAFFAFFLCARVFLFPLLFFAGGKNTQRKRARAARHKALFPVVRGLFLFVLAGIFGIFCAHAHHVLHHFRRVHIAVFHHAGKAVFHRLQVFARDSELLHDVIQRLDAQLARTGKAIALVFHFAVLHTLHEHNGRAFFAFVTKHSSRFLSGPQQGPLQNRIFTAAVRKTGCMPKRTCKDGCPQGPGRSGRAGCRR